MRLFRPRLTAAVAVAILGGGLAASPASADQGANVGAGELTAFVSLSGVPPLLTSTCQNMTFSYSASGEGVVFNDNGTQYPGHVSFTGGGSDPCPFLERENGAISVNSFVVTEAPPINASLSCSFTQGSYIRVGTHVHITVPGACTINAWASGPVLFVSDGEFAPLSGNGINTPVTAAEYAGAFAIAP